MKHLFFCVTNDLLFDQRMSRICSSLSNEQYEITLVGRKLPSSPPLEKTSYHQKRLNCFCRNGKMMYLEFNARLFFYLFFSKPGLIIAVDLDTILPCYLVSKIKGIRRVYDAHELFTELKEVVTRPAIQKIWLAIEKRLVPRYPDGYTVSGSIAEEFKKRYGVDYAVIMNAPLLKAKVMKSGNAGKFLLYQGAVNEGRGLEWLVPAMQQVNAELWICGEGNYSAKCRQMIRDLDLDKKVIMKGMLKPEELQRITAEAYAGINLVEPEGLNQVYSLANKFFDYIHAGIPQLTMNFPEYSRINSAFEVALLIDSLSSGIIAGALNNLLLNEVLYARLSGNCRAAAEAYNWQKEEVKLKQFYKKISA